MNEADNINEQLSNLQRGLGRIEGKFDAVLVGMKAHENRFVTMGERLEHADTETAIRVRKLEDHRNKAVGASSLLGTLVGAFGYFVASRLHF